MAALFQQTKLLFRVDNARKYSRVLLMCAATHPAQGKRAYVGNRKFSYLFCAVGYMPNVILFTMQIDQPPAEHFKGLAGPLIAIFM